MPSTLFTRLKQRRVFQYLGIYLGVGWGVVEFVDWLVKRYLLSSSVTDVALVTLLSLVPTAVLLAYTHGAPGKDGWGRAEKVGVPLNLVATAILLAALFHTRDVGAATERIVVTDEEGQSTERQVPKAAHRRKVALFFWTNESGDEELDWLQYGFPVMLAQDLEQDPFIEVRTPYAGYGKYFYARLQKAGYADGLNVPVSLQREVAKAYHLPYFIDGELDRDGELLQTTVTLYRSEPAREVAKRTFSDADPLLLVDRMASQIKTDLEIPEGSEKLAGDLPVAEHMSESREAIEDYVAGLNAELLASDGEQAIDFWRRAAERDPSFALAHFRRAIALFGLGRTREAQAALAAVVRHDYKLTERDRFVAKGWDLLIKGEIEKRTSLFEMWTELYPDDVTAQMHLAEAYAMWDDRIDDAIAVYRRIHELDPSADWALNRIASHLVGKERYEEAIAVYQRYSELHPEAHSPFISVGDVYERMGELEKAREQYEKANVLSSGVVVPTLSLARIDLKQGKVDDARRRLEKTEALIVNPQTESLVLRAWLEFFRLRGQIERSVELLARLSEIESKYRMPLDVMIDLGILGSETYVLAGRKEEALARLAELSSTIEPPFDGFVNFGYLLAHLTAEDPDRAEIYLEKVKHFSEDFNRNDILSLAALGEGRIRELRGEHEAAVAAYGRALDLNAESAKNALFEAYELTLLTALGRAQRLAGRPEAAAESLSEVLRVFPSYPEAHLELARLHEASDDSDAAGSHLAAALEMWEDADPGYGPAREARSLAETRPVTR